MAAKTEVVAIKVTPEDKELIQKLAAEKDWTVSKWLYNKLIKAIQEERENVYNSSKPENN